MGRLVDGKWETRDLGPDERGRFVRRAAKFRGLVTTDRSSEFSPEAGRYHLYVSPACGWSHRTLIFRKLKGLETAIDISIADPFMGQQGWVFGATRDPVNGVDKLYELYTKARPDYTGRVSVPVLWDKKTKAIVSNESYDIIKSFDLGFGSLAHQEPTFFPRELEREIEAMTGVNYASVNNGVYRVGFARSQEAYDEAVTELFARLEELEVLLGERRYLLGDRITAADWCLFTTLIRFDVVYHYHFKCNLKRLSDFNSLWAYTRELYQFPGIAETCDFEQIKRHYYTSHESINPSRVIPMGPRIDFDAPHGRGG